MINELQVAEDLTKDNDRTTLVMCVNYGGRAEITDAVKTIAEKAAKGKLSARSINEKTVAQHLLHPDVPDVDLFLRTSGSSGCPTFIVAIGLC